MRKILIVGATSAMAEACARLWAQRGDKLFLAARNAAQLQSVADDLKARGAAHVDTKVFDANEFDLHASLLADATVAMGGLDTVLIAHGTLSDQERAQQDVGYALQEIQTNGTSVVSLMTLAGEQLAQQGHGAIAVISSVAGDRGRQSNYVYGSAKALVSAFASGLRQRLSKRGVHVMVRPPSDADEAPCGVDRLRLAAHELHHARIGRHRLGDDRSEAVGVGPVDEMVKQSCAKTTAQVTRIAILARRQLADVIAVNSQRSLRQRRSPPAEVAPVVGTEDAGRRSQERIVPSELQLTDMLVAVERQDRRRTQGLQTIGQVRAGAVAIQRNLLQILLAHRPELNALQAHLSAPSG